MADALTELRGLHMPPMDLSDVVGEVCAALAVGLLVAWALAGMVRLVMQRRIPPETVALRRLQQVCEGHPDAALAARAAILQDYAAGLEGEGDWLSRLDTHWGGVFSAGPGKGLREALYRPQAAFDLAAFDTMVTAALKRVAR